MSSVGPTIKGTCDLHGKFEGYCHECYFPDTPEKQINRLANFILNEVPGEPSKNEGVVDCAIRIIRNYMKREAQ